MAYTVETRIRINDDESGAYVEIAPDADGLGLIEMRYIDEEPVRFVPLPPAMARKVAEAMLRVADEIEKEA